MPSAEEWFRAKVIDRGGHEVWTGSVDQRGVGMVRIDGNLRTVQRAAWEFAYGTLPEGGRVNTCAVERACVQIDHLSATPVSLTMPIPVAQAPRQGLGFDPPATSGRVGSHRGRPRRPDGHPHRRSRTVKSDRAVAERAVSARGATRRVGAAGTAGSPLRRGGALAGDALSQVVPGNELRLTLVEHSSSPIRLPAP